MEGWLVAAGAGSAVLALVALLAGLLVYRMRTSRHKGVGDVRFGLVLKKSPYDPEHSVEVPAQVGTHRKDSVAEGMLAVLHAPRRARSTGCLLEEEDETNLDLKKSSSSTSLVPWEVSSFSNPTKTVNGIQVEKKPNDDPDGKIIALKRCPYLEYSMSWTSLDCVLTVNVPRVTSLPPKYQGCSTSLALTLTRPGKPSVTKTSQRLRGVSLNPEFREVFTFAGIEQQEVEGSELLFEVQARRQGHLINRCIGDLRIPLSYLYPDIPITQTTPITLKRKREDSREAKTEVWGELEVLAQYKETGARQARLKLVIKRAQNNMVTNGKAGVEYRVEVVCKCGGETQDVLQTKGALGPNPVWQAPFIFHLTQAKLSEYRLELGLIRTTLLKRVTLGHASLGLHTTPQGHNHWSRVTIEQPESEITLWHPLVLGE